MPNRCRRCTTNDHDALIEQIAKETWESGGHGWSWEETSPMWHAAFRRHAAVMQRSLELDHG